MGVQNHSARGDVEDQICADGIKKCGWSLGNKIASRHVRRDGMGDVAGEVFILVPRKQVKQATHMMTDKHFMSL